MSSVLGGGVHIDTQILVETRMLVQANSGGGKSHAIRRLLEQTANHVQQIIIDPEGEFSSLREKFDYVLCAPSGADAVANPRTAKLLARRLLETGVSAVLDIYELKAHERQTFVRIFCETLVNAPKKLWHPALIVIDEAHVYCPEKGKSECTAAIIDLASRGRKRGFGLILATQRIAKLSKDAAAEMQNKITGLTLLDIDVRRVSDELGMTFKEAMMTLRNLEAGEFYVFGPALTRSVEKIKVGSVITTHPKPGQRVLNAPPAASKKIKKVLAELADLPTEAEHESVTLDEFKKELTATKRKLTVALNSQQGVPEPEVRRRIKEAVANVKPVQTVGSDDKHHKTLTQILSLADKAINGKGKAVLTVAATHKKQPIASTPAPGLTGPQQRILNSLAWWEATGAPAPYHKVQVAFIAGYSPKGSSFTNPLSALRTLQYVEYPSPGHISLTDEGRDLAEPQTKPSGNDELHQRIFEKLTGPQRKILQPLIDNHPIMLNRLELATRSGYSEFGSSFTNPLSSLRSLGLIDYPQPGSVVALPVLFIESPSI